MKVNVHGIFGYFKDYDVINSIFKKAVEGYDLQTIKYALTLGANQIDEAIEKIRNKKHKYLTKILDAQRDLFIKYLTHVKNNPHTPIKY